MQKEDHVHLLVMTLALVFGAFNIDTAPASTLVVTTASEEINGNTSSPGALIAAPGPDGISLPEAMQAANQVQGPHRIEFDATLNGASIILTGGLPTISMRGLTIDGDIDGDGVPDITIDGSGSSSDTGFQIRTSETTIVGLDIQGFLRHGVHISTDANNGVTEVNNIEIRNCRVTSGWGAIAIHIWQQEDCVIRDIVIRDNELLNSGGGVSITPATGVANRNQILDVTVQGNTISNSTSGIAISAMGGQEPGTSNNLIQGLDILGNTITGHNDVSVLISGGNASSCQFNRVDDVLIAGNTIDGTPVTMELVGAGGGNATNNVVSNVNIVHNQLTGGGIQLATGYDYNTSNNRVEDITIGWNIISGCVANGVMAVAGSTGASWNTIQRVDIVNNLITDCNSGAGILLHGNDGLSPDNLISNINIVNNTIIGNGNSWAGGININTKHSSNQIVGVNISSTILWGNSGADAIRGSIAPDTVSYSLLGDTRYVGSDGNFYDDPLFVEPATINYRLQDTSPAIDEGDPVAAGAGDYDLDLADRLWDGDDDLVVVVDIGAYEYGATPYPTDTHTLTLAKSGTGSGNVTSIPAGIDCGEDCSGDYDHDTLVSLTANPADGSAFVGWSGGGCSGYGTCHVTMDEAKTIDAGFAINLFTVGGTVGGLEGSGLVLQNNTSDDLPIAANGSFTFATALPDGSAYVVTVLTQPDSPVQTCSVSNGSGTLASTNVSNVVITCELIRTAAPTVTAPLVEADTAVSGTAEANAAVEVFVNGSSAGSTGANGAGAWTLSGILALVAGQQVTAVATAPGKAASDLSSAVVVLARTAVPSVTAPLVEADTVVSGTAEANAAVEVFVNGSSAGSTGANGAGAWTLSGIAALITGQQVTAVATAPGKAASDPSSAVSVLARTAAPTVTAPLVEADTAVSGMAEANAAVEVFVNGSSAGSTGADGGGDWTLSGIAALIAGQQVTAVATAPGKAASVPSSAVAVLARTAAPTVAAPLVEGDTAVFGTTEANAAVEVFVNGSSAGSTGADGAGDWTLSDITALITGQQVTAVATAPGKAASDPSSAVAVLARTAAPTVTAPLVEADTVVSGTAEANAAVEVFVNGSSAGSTGANGAGAWTLSGIAALITGQQVTAVATVPGKAASDPSSAVSVLARTAAPTVTAPLVEADTAVSGTSEGNAGVEVFVNGSSAGSTGADGGGAWTLSGIAALIAGQQVTAVATAPGKAASEPSSAVSVLARSATPTVTAPLVEADTAVSGTAEANAAVEVFVNGSSAGSTGANGAGAWTLSGIAALIAGQQVTAVATAPGKAASDPSSAVAVLARTVAPTVTAPLVEADTAVSGTAEGNATVEVFVNGPSAGSTDADGGGAWTLSGIAALIAGQQVTAVATAPGKAASDPSSAVTVSHSLSEIIFVSGFENSTD